MNRKGPTINEIDEAVKLYFKEKIEAVAPVPPPPHGENVTGVKRFAAVKTAIPKVAAAVLLIACGAFFFIRPVKSNPFTETFVYLTEERQLEAKIVSGLQRAGHFISDTLEEKEEGVRK